MSVNIDKDKCPVCGCYYNWKEETCSNENCETNQ